MVVVLKKRTRTRVLVSKWKPGLPRRERIKLGLDGKRGRMGDGWNSLNMLMRCINYVNDSPAPWESNLSGEALDSAERQRGRHI